MSVILDKGVAFYFMQRMKNLDKMKKDPFYFQSIIQRALLDGLINTQFASDFQIKTFKDWKHLPLLPYEELFPYIQRAMYGEKNVLWPGKTPFFAKSSGTSNAKSKYIPLTKYSLQENHYKAGKDVLGAYYHAHPQSNLYKGKHLILGGSSNISDYRDASVIGDLSAHIINNLPFWVERKRTPSKSAALLPSWDEKLKRLIAECAHEDVRIIAGVPTWALSLIKNILKDQGVSSIFEIWPNLEVYLHGGVHLDPFKNAFDSLFEGQVNFVENYNASEGIFAIQEYAGQEGMSLLLNHGVYYEFLPLGKPAIQQNLIPLEAVQLHEKYEMFISTFSGLWRYTTGDLIEFTHLQPFHIKVAGRTKQHINVFGEELMLNELAKAIALAAEATHARVVNFHLAPIFPSNTVLGGHEYLIEFEQEPEDFDIFKQLLDQNLKLLNSDYEAKRAKSGGIQELKVTSLKKGVIEQWHRQKNKMGGQHKLPQMATNRDLLEQLLKINQNSL